MRKLIWYISDIVSVASGGEMEKCGLKYEGTLRKADWSNKGIVDAAMYGLIRGEHRRK